MAAEHLLLERAEQFLLQYPNLNGTKVSDVYDGDEMLRSVLLHLFPDFEYPDFAHRTLRSLYDQYAKSHGMP